MLPISADERAVRQVTLNLLTNAIKFTPPGGTIAVKAGWTRNGGQYVSIKDSGPGIPADEIVEVGSQTVGTGRLREWAASQGAP